MAIYEIDDDDAQKVITELATSVQDMELNDSLDMAGVAALIFSPISEKKVEEKANV